MTVILNINDEIIDARQAVSELTKAGAKHAKASSLHAAVTRWLKMKSYDTLVTTVRHHATGHKRKCSNPILVVQGCDLSHPEIPKMLEEERRRQLEHKANKRSKASADEMAVRVAEQHERIMSEFEPTGALPKKPTKPEMVALLRHKGLKVTATEELLS
jgi:hypothetical protein